MIGTEIWLAHVRPERASSSCATGCSTQLICEGSNGSSRFANIRSPATPRSHRSANRRAAQSSVESLAAGSHHHPLRARPSPCSRESHIAAEPARCDASDCPPASIDRPVSHDRTTATNRCRRRIQLRDRAHRLAKQPAECIQDAQLHRAAQRVAIAATRVVPHCRRPKAFAQPNHIRPTNCNRRRVARQPASPPIARCSRPASLRSRSSAAHPRPNPSCRPPIRSE